MSDCVNCWLPPKSWDIPFCIFATLPLSARHLPTRVRFTSSMASNIQMLLSQWVFWSPKVYFQNQQCTILGMGNCQKTCIISNYFILVDTDVIIDRTFHPRTLWLSSNVHWLADIGYLLIIMIPRPCYVSYCPFLLNQCITTSDWPLEDSKTCITNSYIHYDIILMDISGVFWEQEWTITKITGTKYHNNQQISQQINGLPMMTRGYLVKILHLQQHPHQQRREQ